MTDTPNSTPSPDTPRSSWLQWLAQNRDRSAYLLYVAAAVFAALAIATYVRYQTSGVPVTLWFAAMATVLATAGLWQQFRQPGATSELDMARILVLAVGGLTGLATTLFLGVGLAVKWENTLTGGWQAWQGENAWQIWVIVAALFGGLAIMFLSLQIVSGEVRQNPVMRRLVYGYNAGLAGLLLLAILALLNGLAYTPWGPFKYLNRTYPWTDASIYDLSSKSQNILQGLTKPVKVYAILPVQDAWYRPVRALLDNCQSATEKVQVEMISPDLDVERARQLASEYNVGERRGLLVVYGTPPDVNTRFINYQELQEQPDFMSRNQARVFRGETALMTELSFLVEGKEKPVVYFTQGNGELDLNEMPGQAMMQLDEGLGALKQSLQQNNYIVKGLQLAPVAGVGGGKPDVVVSNQVPADAAIVVIAGPRQPFAEHALKALRDYMNPADPNAKKGKLVALLDPTLNPEKTGLLRTGLESLLAEYNVQVGNDRVLQLGASAARSPTDVLARTNPSRAVRDENPIAAAFAPLRFVLYGVRTVDAPTGTEQRPSNFRTESLIVAAPEQIVWAETDVATPATELILELERKGELDKRITGRIPSLGVVVTETAPSGLDPHAGLRPGTPRLIVVGDSTFVCNAVISDRGSGRRFFDLFSSCLAWLRERPSNIGIEPKKADVFAFTPSSRDWPMIWIPGVLMLVGIIGLGTGVWVVRRR
jgi:hypothetical protein